MKINRRQDKRLGILITVLLLLTIPITLLGFQQVEDLRRQAAEEEVLIEFTTDFSSPGFSTAYLGIPYLQTFELSGKFIEIVDVELGCDVEKCGDTCSDTEHSPPEGLTLADDHRSLYWENPAPSGTTAQWPVTLTAYAPSPDEEGSYVCESVTFTLTLQEEIPDIPPTCTLHGEKNQSAVPAGYALPFILEADDTDDGITSAQVTFVSEGGEETTTEWTFDEPQDSILLNKNTEPPLTFSNGAQGSYSVSGSVTDESGTTAECDVPQGAEINIVIPGDNGSPVFMTDPYADSKPSTDINVDEAYTYTVEAKDPDGDDIDFYVINRTGWLSFTLNENSEGIFKATLSGTPTAPGSYTAVVALNDGFHNHYTTQLWVINVNSVENDIPNVIVDLPEDGITLQQNQNVQIQWRATDSNLIKQFDIFLATDPTNNDTWKLLTSLGYNFTSYVWNTGSTPTGTYYIVVQAADNQEPAGVGTGVSGAFGIGVSPTPKP